MLTTASGSSPRIATKRAQPDVSPKYGEAHSGPGFVITDHPVSVGVSPAAVAPRVRATLRVGSNRARRASATATSRAAAATMAAAAGTPDERETVTTFGGAVEASRGPGGSAVG